MKNLIQNLLITTLSFSSLEQNNFIKSKFHLNTLSLNTQVFNLQKYNWLKGERDNKIEWQCDKSVKKMTWFEENEWDESWSKGNKW